MTEFNQRERYLLTQALESQIRKLQSSKDFPEWELFNKLRQKAVRWTYEIKGDITSDEGVGE